MFRSMHMHMHQPPVPLPHQLEPLCPLLSRGIIQGVEVDAKGRGANNLNMQHQVWIMECAG